MKQQITALDEYMLKAYKWVVLSLTLGCVAAMLSVSGIKYLGGFQTVSWSSIAIFLCSDFIYVGIGIFLIKNCMKDEKLKPRFLLAGKIFISFVIIVQWNAFSYIVPFRDLWGFAFFFLIFAAFFLDTKLILIDLWDFLYP